MATEIDVEQSTQIAALEKDVELLRAEVDKYKDCLLYTSPSPRDRIASRMPSSA